MRKKATLFLNIYLYNFFYLNYALEVRFTFLSHPVYQQLRANIYVVVY